MRKTLSRLLIAILVAVAIFAVQSGGASAGSAGKSASPCSWHVGNCGASWYNYSSGWCNVEWYTYRFGYYQYDIHSYNLGPGWYTDWKYFEGNRRGDQVTITCAGDVYFTDVAPYF